MQIFVRRRDGIESLSRLLRQLTESGNYMSRSTAVAGELQAALIEIHAVKAELAKFGNARGDSDLQRVRAALRKRLRVALRELSGT